MQSAQREALLSALRSMGETEFWADQIEHREARLLFQRYKSIFAEYAASLGRRRPSGPIPFVFLGGSNFNARAFRHGEHEFIGINWGAVVVIHDLFLRMLSAPDVLPHVGDSKQESAAPRLPNLILDAAKLPCSAGHPFAMDISPCDPLRAMYAMNLAQIALDFLFVHEHQHAAGGHLSLVPGASSFEEIDMPQNDVFTRHVLELEADAAAANFSLGIACDVTGNAWRMPSALASHLGTIRSREDAWLFAIWTVFLLMEGAVNQAFFSGRPLPLTHPACIRRRAFLATYVFQRRARIRSGDTFKRAAAAFAAVHRAMIAVAEGQEQTLIGLDIVGEDEAGDLDLLAARWRELQPVLAQQAKGNGVNSAPPDLIEACRSF
jgi:hypothetical protein